MEYRHYNENNSEKMIPHMLVGRKQIRACTLTVSKSALWISSYYHRRMSPNSAPRSINHSNIKVTLNMRVFDKSTNCPIVYAIDDHPDDILVCHGTQCSAS